jgi:hypothetical protein
VGRDHSIECERCGVSYGGFNDETNRHTCNAADVRRRAVAGMCPHQECRAAGECLEMGSAGVLRFCRLRPPLDAVARRKP